MDLNELLGKRLNQKLSEKPSLLADFSAVVQLEVGREIWHLDPQREDEFIQCGAHSAPDCSIQMSENDFEKLIHRELNIPLALAFRKIKIKGNPVYLSKLKELFG